MPISDKTRKILWGRSGNRCAICKRELIENFPDESGLFVRASVIGAECHIISRQSNGPRHDPNFPEDQFDSEGNLILLCQVHHKKVDDQIDFYTIDTLKKIKFDHETAVSQRLSCTSSVGSKMEAGNISDIPLRSGQDVLYLVNPAHIFSYNNVKLNSEEEMNIVSEFFQEIYDWDEIKEFEGPAGRIKFEYELDKYLDRMRQLGLLVFGSRKFRVINFISGQVKMLVSTLNVKRGKD